MVGSELGDSFIIGPFYNKNTKQIWFAPVKNPEQIRPMFSTRDYNELVGFIHHFRLTEAKARMIWGDALEGVELSPYLSGKVGESQTQMLDVVQYWDDKEMILLLGGGDNTTAGSMILDYDEHNWGFIPLQYVRNIIDPNGPFGISDMEIMLDAQVEYNESASYTSDVLRAAALPHIFGKNLEISEFTAGTAQILDLGDESEVFANPMAGISAPWETYGASRQKDVWGLSGINEIMYGGPRVREATGRALSVLMQGVQNRIRGRQERWKLALQDLVAGIFRLMEIYVPGGKDLVQGQYGIDIFFPSTLVRNVAEEINKFNSKLQSQTTTMKNMGVPSPTREKKLINKELQDPITMAEISRNPGLQMQLMQQLQQQQQQEGQQASPSQLTEGGDQEERPMNSPGQASPVNAGNKSSKPPAQINE